mgnify:CR=1 FL=1
MTGKWQISFIYTYLTSLIVFLGMLFGTDCLRGSRHGDFTPPDRVGTVAGAYSNWDGAWYTRIAQDGYTYDPSRMSSVAFFPAYPLLGRALAWATSLPQELALAVLSQLLLWATLALLMAYVRGRHPGEEHLPAYTAVALALFPLSFFFRAAYTESLFVFLAVLTLYGLERRWPVLVVAVVVGLATATRATGIALVPPLVLGVWRTYPSTGTRIRTLAWAVPLSCWGLAGYVVYQGAAFGEPLAFAQTQKHWRFRPSSTLAENLGAVATLEPLWSVYDPVSPAYWGRHDKELSPAFSLQFANPLYLVGAVALIACGVWRRWLSPAEILLAVGLIGIPYLTRSYYTCMASQARFATAVFPIYIVLGRLLVRVPPPMGALCLAGSGFLLGVYSALFAARFLFI